MLGQYASFVLSAYAVTFVLIGGLIVQSVLRSARIRAALSKVERKNGR